ncbi:hypothetical protein H4R20_000081 [Coemansia guatemalensis]|uniref:START domain-containing protein n=1 Tax=Coemansia guatemalensis TaxID=2761395 RepID=A0A9W8I8D8_9FUNG|nr:hypothetical protein H4R20_000081 [Coemansia guatemalensis]
MTVVASLALPIPALSALNKYAIQYPLDRLHYAMFQLLLMVLVPLLVLAMHWPGDRYRLEVAHYDSVPPAAQTKHQPKPAQQSTTSQDCDSNVSRTEGTRDAAHRYAAKCAELEQRFIQMAAGDSDPQAEDIWKPLTALKQPYPVTVEGHVSKPFCFRVIFYAPTQPGTAFDLLSSILKRPQWDELTESTRIVEKLGPCDAIHYIKMKAVWPTAARDSLLLSHLAAVQTGNGETAYLNVSQSIVDHRVPENVAAGIVRMEAGIAGQIVTQITPEELQHLGLDNSKSWCKVVQIADGDLRGWIPKSVIKFIATKALPRSLTKVCRQLSTMPSRQESLLLENASDTLPPTEAAVPLDRPATTYRDTAAVGEGSTSAVAATRPRISAMWLLRVLLRYAVPAVVAAIATLIFKLIARRR